MVSHGLDIWVDRLRNSAAARIPDRSADAVWALADRQSRSRTARLIAASITGRPSGIRAEDLGLDEQLLAVSATPGTEPPPPPADGAGPLTARDPGDVIEVWTERELASVHAAWSVEGWRERAVGSARWLLEEIQPDNATNLPWAVHVFAWLGASEGLVEATMYAETLLHNCVVQGAGVPDGLSALILLDAAGRLEREIGGA